MRVLVLGGAGFIGSHLVRLLRDRGYEVRVFDTLDPQVHGADGGPPASVRRGVDFVRGDIRDPEALRGVLDGVGLLVHLAAVVGVGQSMYQMARYMEVNAGGTATLLDLLAHVPHAVRKIVVASSMSIYGEGAYRCGQCGPVAPGLRPTGQLLRREWEPTCPQCGEAVTATPTPETKPLLPASVYAISKRDQEDLCLCFGRAYGIPTVALRLFNVYGPGQALSNPYTGVAAIFSARLLNGKPPLIFEDGRQSRDLIHVHDVCRAILLAMEREEADGLVLNVGTGRPTTILDLARALGVGLGWDGDVEVLGRFREGDIRHCYADISRIRAVLGFEPEVDLATGAGELVEWVRAQRPEDGVDRARHELEAKALIK
ncbi:MAG: NAD-dependent epimerase/dehydratase family protein [Chloroflexi bacterium]|nr:NAD-dependent epimerase/dehydratase family protein [Chloroflexota bacterium]